MSNTIRYDDHMCMHELLHSWEESIDSNIKNDYINRLLDTLKTKDTVEIYVNMYTLMGIPSHMENLLVDVPNIKTVRFILDNSEYNYAGYIPYRYHTEPDWNDSWIPKMFEFTDNVYRNLNIEFTFDMHSIIEQTHMPEDHFNKNIEFLKRLRWKTYAMTSMFSYTFSKHYGATAYWFETLNRYNPSFTAQAWDSLVTGKY
jgi:hypothetical protein